MHDWTEREREEGAAEDWRWAKSLLLLLEMHKATGNVQVEEQEQGWGAVTVAGATHMLTGS